MPKGRGPAWRLDHGRLEIFPARDPNRHDGSRRVAGGATGAYRRRDDCRVDHPLASPCAGGAEHLGLEGLCRIATCILSPIETCGVADSYASLFAAAPSPRTD